MSAGDTVAMLYWHPSVVTQHPCHAYCIRNISLYSNNLHVRNRSGTCFLDVHLCSCVTKQKLIPWMGYIFWCKLCLQCYQGKGEKVHLYSLHVTCTNVHDNPSYFRLGFFNTIIADAKYNKQWVWRREGVSFRAELKHTVISKTQLLAELEAHGYL